MNSQFPKRLEDQRAKVDVLFLAVLFFQWALAVVLALWASPGAWGEADPFHLRAALGLGGLLAIFPFLHVRFAGARSVSRLILVSSQMGFSVLLIHLTGGRIETHFHVFGSLALISFYRNSRLLILATVITLFDHLVRGYFWPQSVYGVLSAGPWRAMEHAAWVVFEDVFLLFGIAVSRRELMKSVEDQLALREALYNSERNLRLAEKMRTALDHVAIVTTTDPEGKITDVNRNFEELSGFSREELLGQNHRMMKSGVHSQDLFQDLWSTLKRGEVWRGEVCNKAKNGSLHWLDTRIVPVRDQTGKIEEYVALRLDITRRKALEDELHEMNEKLEARVNEKAREVIQAEAKLASTAKLAALGEMAGGIAHEINNPLMILIGKGELLRELFRRGVVDPVKCMAHVDAMLATTDRIAKIIRGMKSVSRSAAFDSMEPVGIAALLEDVLSLCSEKFKSKGVSLTVHQGAPGLRVEGRLVELSQVLLNLLNNAYDAISGDSEAWVKISVEVNGPHLDVFVENSGAKIPAEVRQKIFEPFFTTKAPGKGTGLGLSISSSIMRAHGGDLSLDETRPHTCFRLRFPVLIAA